MTHVQQRNATACSVMPTSASTAFGRSVTDACSTVAMKLELSNDIEKLALMKKGTSHGPVPLLPSLGLLQSSFFSASTTSERLLDAVTYSQRVKHKNLFLRKSCHQSPRPQPITSYTILYSGFICGAPQLTLRSPPPSRSHSPINFDFNDGLPLTPTPNFRSALELVTVISVLPLRLCASNRVKFLRQLRGCELRSFYCELRSSYRQTVATSDG